MQTKIKKTVWKLFLKTETFELAFCLSCTIQNIDVDQGICCFYHSLAFCCFKFFSKLVNYVVSPHSNSLLALLFFSCWCFYLCPPQSLERGGSPQAEHAGLRCPTRRSGVAAGGARQSGGRHAANKFASGDSGVGGGEQKTVWHSESTFIRSSVHQTTRWQISGNEEMTESCPVRSDENSSLWLNFIRKNGVMRGSVCFLWFLLPFYIEKESRLTSTWESDVLWQRWTLCSTSVWKLALCDDAKEHWNWRALERKISFSRKLE